LALPEPLLPVATIMVAIVVVILIMAIALRVATTVLQGPTLLTTPITMAAYGYPAIGAGTGGTAAYGLADTGGKLFLSLNPFIFSWLMD